MSNQASGDELAFIVNEYRDINRNEFTQVTAKCKCGRGGWVRLDKHPAIQSLIRTEKLKLLDEVRERVVDKPTGNHNADSLLERDVLIYNQATAYLRTELAKLEAEL